MKRLAMLLCAVVVAASALAEAKVRNVAIFVQNGTEVLDFSGPAEVLAAASSFAAQGDKPLNIFLVGPTKETITSQGFIKVTPDYGIADAPKIDILVIPGGNGAALAEGALFEWFKKTIPQTEITLTVCTGAVPLAKSGLVDGLEITTWYGAIASLQRDAPKVTVKDGRRFIDNGKYITTAGVSAGIDGSLHLVARLFGRYIADQTARYMEYHWTPEPYLARDYPLLNPSTDDRGRAAQLASIHRESKNWRAAQQAYIGLTQSDAKDANAWLGLAEVLREQGKHEESIVAYQHAAEVSERRRPFALAAIARAYALLDRRADAIAYLSKAVDAGFRGAAMLAQEPAFASYRDDAQVKTLLAKMQ